MLAKICSATVMGVEACAIKVEVNFGYADTQIVIVGLPDAAVKERREGWGRRGAFPRSNSRGQLLS